MFAFKLISLISLLSLASASPFTPRAGNFPAVPGDNGSCQEIGQLCSAQIGNNGQNIYNNGGEFSISKECTLSAICFQQYEPQFTLDEWIGLWFNVVVPAGTSPSLTAHRLPQGLYNTLVESGTSVATQQSFIDAYYSLLATVGGPYPDVSYVITAWAKVAAWTGFCDTKNIPYDNLADWC